MRQTSGWWPSWIRPEWPPGGKFCLTASGFINLSTILISGVIILKLYKIERLLPQIPRIYCEQVLHMECCIISIYSFYTDTCIKSHLYPTKHMYIYIKHTISGQYCYISLYNINFWVVNQWKSDFRPPSWISCIKLHWLVKFITIYRFPMIFSRYIIS